jgi:hypothetical protein
MKNHKYLLITIVSVFTFNSHAQKAEVTPKNKTKYVEIDVIKTYERVAIKGYKSIDMFQKLGNSYYTNFEMEKAARWYCELFTMTTDLEPKYYYQYEQSLRSIGQNDEANAIIEKFNQKNRKR